MKTQVVVVVEDPAAASAGDIHEGVLVTLRREGWNVVDSYVRAGKNCPDNTPCLRDREVAT